MPTNLDYKLVVTAYLDQDIDNPIQNQFWYKASSADAHAGELATVFNANVVPGLARVVTSSLVFTTIEITNLVDLQDFTTMSLGTPGERTSTYTNRWDAWAFQFLRPIRGMNNGSKRLGPIATLDYSKEVPVSSMLQLLDETSDDMEAPLPTLGGATYSPCCVKTIKVANANGNGKFHYEPDELYICNSVAFQRVAHQDSRGAS